MSGLARRTRSGVATLAILLIVILLTIAVFSYFSTMRQRRLQQYKNVLGDMAYGLGLVGLDIGREHLLGSLRSAGSPLTRELAKSLGDLLGAQDPASHRIPLGHVDFLRDYSTLVDDVASRFEGGASLVQTLEADYFLLDTELKPFGKLLPPLDTNDREKQGKIFLDVHVTLHAGSGLESDRHFLGYYEFRAIWPVAPVYSEFTLLTASPPEDGDPARLNSIKTDWHGNPAGGSGPQAPLILFNGDQLPRADWAKKLPPDPLNALRDQGWIYLGNDKELTLNLVYGRDEDTQPPDQQQKTLSEDYLFFHQSPRFPAAGRSYKDDQANGAIGSTSFWEIRFWDMGVLPVFGAAPASPMGQYQPLFEAVDFNQAGTSVLHLYGRVGLVSPTLVFGPVSAGYMRISAAYPKGVHPPDDLKTWFCLLRNVADNQDLGSFYEEVAGLAGPGQTELTPSVLATDLYKSGKFLFLQDGTTTLRAKSDPRVAPAVYRQIMSGSFRRPYDQGILYLASNSEDEDPAVHSQNFGLPAEMVTASSGAADPDQTVPDTVWGQRRPSSAVSLTRLAKEMKSDAGITERASRECSAAEAKDFAGFLRREGFLKGNTLDLGGVLLVKGPVTIPDITVRHGGMIVADDIQLEGEVRRDQVLPEDVGAPPLVLWATRGGVRMLKRALVEASLIAPAGSVSSAKGMQVAGQVVAGKLDLAGVEGDASPSSLTYDKTLKTWLGATGNENRFLIDVAHNFVRVE